MKNFILFLLAIFATLVVCCELDGIDVLSFIFQEDDIMKNTKVIMDSVVDDFNTIVNEGFTARHEVLNRESSINAAKFNQALGIASSDDYRARYIALLNCIVDYMDHLD